MIGSRSRLPRELEASETDPYLTSSLFCPDSWLSLSERSLNICIGCFRSLMRLGSAEEVYARRSGDVISSL